MSDPTWSESAYARSVSSRCWAYTPYSDGWSCPALPADPAMRALVAQEASLAPVPAWACQVVERSIQYLPGCPHGSFPVPYVEVLDAIGAQAPPAFVHGCYTADARRKSRLQDYVFCLDAWLAGATAGQAAAEVARRSPAPVDWPRVCDALWEVLGPRTELKELLLRRILHRQRWWLKALVWDDDGRDACCRDQYLGDVATSGSGYGHYGNPPFNDPYFAELEVPAVQRLEERLAALCPDWPWFRSCIRDSWLCGPKAFRFLERLLWCVGRQQRVVTLPSHPLANAERVPPFLQCQDTYPDAAQAREWVQAFVSGIRSWRRAEPPAGTAGADAHGRLGKRTAVKDWLTGLYLRKLEFLDPYGGVTG